MNAAKTIERDGCKRTLLAKILVLKLLFVGFALAWAAWIPISNTSAFRQAPRWPQDCPPSFWGRFTLRDAAFYLNISSAGYAHSGERSTAFYPLWPILISSFKFDRPGIRIAGALLLSAALSVAGLMVFHALASLHVGKAVADKALVLLLAFPGSLFFNLIYTEALFFLLITGAFLCLERGEPARAAVLGFLLPLTKAIGLLCVLPVLWRQFQNPGSTGDRKLLSKQAMPSGFARFAWRSLPAAAIGMGFCAYLFLMWSETGNMLQGFRAQRLFPTEPSIMKLFDPAGFWECLVNVGSFHGMLDSLLDRLCFVAVVCSLPLLYHLNRVWFAYTAIAGCIPAVSAWMISYTRHVSVCFPVFILWALLFARFRNPSLFWLISGLFVLIQGNLLVRQLDGFWAG